MRQASNSQVFVGHFRKISILVINFIFNRMYVFSFLGFLNRHLNFIGSIFVAYPASEEYALAYVYPRHRHLMRWSPYLVGIFLQNRKWGVMFVISSTEKDFIKPENEKSIRNFVKKTEHIRDLLGAPQKTFAGILPGVLFAKRIIRETVETDVTVEAITKAEDEVRKAEKYDSNVPLIVLGGMGFVGRRFIRKMKDRKSYCVDLVHKSGCQTTWPHHITGQKAILINLTRKATLNDYLNLFWPELVLINEVYPEPSENEINILRKIGSPAYHIVGIAAKSYPSFPKAYAGGIPCCAGRLSENMRILVKKLN